MTHPAKYHSIDLTMTPKEASVAIGMPMSVAVSMLKNKRRKCGVTKQWLMREKIEPLIMRHGVTIDECAERFSMSPASICKIMGWD